MTAIASLPLTMHPLMELCKTKSDEPSIHSQSNKALDAVLLTACKKILCCSSKTCSEAVWGDLGIQ